MDETLCSKLDFFHIIYYTNLYLKLISRTLNTPPFLSSSWKDISAIPLPNLRQLKIGIRFNWLMWLDGEKGPFPPLKNKKIKITNHVKQKT